MFVNLKYVFLAGEYQKDIHDSNKKINQMPLPWLFKKINQHSKLCLMLNP